MAPPAPFGRARAQCEYSHAAGAALNLVALCAVTLSVLAGRRE